MSDEHQPAVPTIPILVELPAYGYSFTVHLPSEPTSTSAASSNTVLSIKHAISRTCPGNPQVDGQRIIWRGRVLGDAEKVGELWPVVEGYGGLGLKRIVHLSVHPSAWTGKPPVISAAREVRESKEVGSEKGKGKEKEIVAEKDDVVNKLRAAAAVTFESSTTTSKSAPTVTTAPSPPPALPAYLISTHRKALSALTDLEGFTPEAFTSSDNEKETAIRFVNAHGYSWPAILDEGYPSTDADSEKGVKYVKDVIDGRPYLRLLNPTETPTAAQKHALKVLSFTFELLKLPTQPSRHTSSPSISNPTAQPNQPGVPVPETTPAVQVPAHLNAVLQQMGLPPITENLPPGVVNVIQQPQQQVPQAQGGVQFDLNQFFNANNLNNNDNNNNNNNNHQIQQINIRPILLPLLMLSLRMFLLLYFVAPARKPFLMLLVLAWVGWEIWGWIAALGVRVEVEIERGGGRMEGGGAGERPPGGGGVPQPAPPPAQQNAAAQAPPAVPAANNPPAPAPAPATPPTLLDNLASFGIAQDQAALESALPLETGSQEPGIARKVLLFLVLFLISVHPAVWNRRRALLRAREGQVRVEMGVLAEGVGEQESGAADNASALETTRRAQRRAEMYVKYMSRPAWVRRYMQRVMSAQAGEGAWVDEAD